MSSLVLVVVLLSCVALLVAVVVLAARAERLRAPRSAPTLQAPLSGTPAPGEPDEPGAEPQRLEDREARTDDGRPEESPPAVLVASGQPVARTQTDVAPNAPPEPLHGLSARVSHAKRPRWRDEVRQPDRGETEPAAPEPVVHKSIKTLRVHRAASPPYPIVLVHGVLGFDAIKVGLLRQEYFRGVARTLRAQGIEVLVARVAPVSSIAVRASQLARQIGRLKARKVNVVAHSMGGLDARYAIARCGLGERVASLTTIGTPHAGTPIADQGLALLADGLHLRTMIQSLGMSAFDDLTTERMAAFNREVSDTRGVRCASYVGAVQGLKNLNVLLIPAHLMLLRAAGYNDGIVPASSQQWGEVLGEIDADHWAQIGWSTSFDAGVFYERVARELRERGL